MRTILDGPVGSDHTVILAHGAGAGMDTPFMDTFAHGIATADWRVIRFEFPYMDRRRVTGKKSPPDRGPVLQQAWLEVLARFRTKLTVIGGKSMGGRIASMIADQAGADGLICLGYPFHPPGKPDRLRTEHLISLKTPTLIVQGERDPFGRRDEITQLELSPAIEIVWVPDGDHSLKPRKSSGFTEEQNLRTGVEAVVEFLHRIQAGR